MGGFPFGIYTLIHYRRCFVGVLHKKESVIKQAFSCSIFNKRSFKVLQQFMIYYLDDCLQIGSSAVFHCSNCVTGLVYISRVSKLTIYRQQNTSLQILIDSIPCIATHHTTSTSPLFLWQKSTSKLYTVTHISKPIPFSLSEWRLHPFRTEPSSNEEHHPLFTFLTRYSACTHLKGVLRDSTSRRIFCVECTSATITKVKFLSISSKIR